MTVPKLIVMLTNNDSTVTEATSIFNDCRDLEIEYWGIKTKPLTTDQMLEFVRTVHASKKKAVFESVCYTEAEGIEDANKAAACNCDILMGTNFSQTINRICSEHKIKYMPFIGKASKVPSILEGTVKDFINDIKCAVENKTFGVDFLAYRHIVNPHQILKEVLQNSQGTNVCVAGSVDSYEKIDEVMKLKPSFFTIGSAFFENAFNGTIREQIKKVYAYLNEEKNVKEILS